MALTRGVQNARGLMPTHGRAGHGRPVGGHLLRKIGDARVGHVPPARGYARTFLNVIISGCGHLFKLSLIHGVARE